MSNENVSVVLAHGAWADGSSWARVITAQRITWPQAVLRDALNAPMVQDYPQTGAVLIGPDGVIRYAQRGKPSPEEVLAAAE